MKGLLDTDAERVQTFVSHSFGDPWIKIISEPNEEFHDLLALTNYGAIKRVYLAGIRDKASDPGMRRVPLNAGKYIVDAAVVESFTENEPFILK